MEALRGLITEKGMQGWTVLSDFVNACQDPEFQMDESTRQMLIEYGLLQPNEQMPHEAVCAVVSCAVQGKDLEMRLTSPLAESKA